MSQRLTKVLVPVVTAVGIATAATAPAESVMEVGLGSFAVAADGPPPADPTLSNHQGEPATGDGNDYHGGDGGGNGGDGGNGGSSVNGPGGAGGDGGDGGNSNDGGDGGGNVSI